MKTKSAHTISKFLTVLFLFTLIFLLTAGLSNVLRAQTLNIDKLDYAPGETVQIVGTGWQPGEVVTLKVDHLSDPIPDHGTPDPHLPWDVTVEADGSFATTWYVSDYELNSELLLTAKGTLSGFYYEIFFTDAAVNKVASVSLSPAQTGTVTYGTSSGATYTVTINPDGSNGGNGSTTLTMTGTPIPTGATATFSVNPVTLPSASSSPIFVTLTITNANITPAGTTNGIAVKASPSNNSNTTTYVVNKAPLSITANSQSKCFGQTFSFIGTEFISSGLVNTDAVSSVTLTSAGTPSSATVAGSPYSIIPSSSVGIGLNNYTIIYNNGTFKVNTLPTVAAITPGGTTNVCVGGTMQLSNATAGGVWTIDNQAIALINSSSGLVTGVSAGTLDLGIHYTITDVNGCSKAANKTLNVIALPTVRITGSSSVCIGSTTTLSPNTGGTWVSNNPTVASVTNAGFVTGLIAGNATFTFTSGTSPNCSATTLAVTVNAIPTTPTISSGGSTTICQGGSVVLTSSSTTGNQWYRTGLLISGQTNQSYTASTNGNYTVVTSANGCPSAPSIGTSVTVNTRPTSIISGTQTICNGSFAELSIAVTGTGPWNGTLSNSDAFSAISSPISVTVSPTETTTYTIATLSDANCTSIAADLTGNATVTLRALPTATIVVNGTNPICSGSASSIKFTGPNNGIVTYKIGGGSNLTITLNPAGIASLTTDPLSANTTYNLVGIAYGDAPNCSNTASGSATVTVNQPPIVTVCPSSFSHNTDPGVCSAVVIYTATATGTPAPTYTYAFTGATTASGSGTGSGATFEKGITSVTVTATNTCGSTTCNFTVTVEDNTPPVAIAQDVTVQLDATGNGSTTAAAVNNGSSDACGIASLVLSKTAFTCDDIATNPNVVTLTVTDNNGNVSTTTATVTVKDEVPPVAIAQNVIVQLDNTGNGSTTAALVNNGSTDACGIKSLALSKTAFTCDDIATNPNVVTLTVTDNHGNVSTTTATVTVKDEVPPVAIAQNVIVQLDNTGNGSTTAALVNNGSTDACGIKSLALSKTAFTCDDIATNPNVVTLTVTDNNGNVSTATANVTVKDEVKPVVTCNASTSKFVDPYLTYYTISDTEFDATATDACGVASKKYAIDGGASSANGASLVGVHLNVGTHTIIWTAVDVNNNESSCTTIITVSKRGTTLVYGGETTKQYSNEISLSATLTDNVSGVVGKTIRFTIGSQYAEGITGTNGVAIAKLVLIQALCSSYNIVTTFIEDGAYLKSSDTDELNYQKEDAVVEYTGPEFLGCPTCSTIQVLLSASVNDILDGFPGDITKAKVRFVITDGAAFTSGWLTPGLVSPGDYTKGIVTQLWNAPVPTSKYTSFTIRVEVASDAGNCSYYIGFDRGVLTVQRTTLTEFITGGGHIVTNDSKGSYPSEPGKKINFGFNVKWNKSVKSLQGNLNLIYRNNGKVYQIKSTAMSSLSVVSTNPCSPKATFVSKCNLNDVTNPNAPINIIGGGGSDLQVTFTDNGEAGTSDLIGVTFYSGTNLVFSSSWPVNKTAEMFLDGGNLVVHNGQTCNATTTSKVVIASSKNPSVVGESVLFSATLTGAGTTAPTGSVIFYDGSVAISSAVALNAGKASYSTSILPSGLHFITAVYSGDTKFGSSAASITQTVNATTTKSGDITQPISIAPQVVARTESSLKAYPNPASGPVTFEFRINENAKTTLDIFAVSGQRIARVFNADVEANVTQTIYFDESLPSGVYVYVLRWNDQMVTGKLIRNK